MAETSTGNLQRVFIPFRNKSLRPVRVLSPYRTRIATISGLSAMVDKNTVVLAFQSSRPGRQLSIYRSTDPFPELYSLTEATEIDEIDSSSETYTDYPVPGIPYYYGIFDQEQIERNEYEIREGANVLNQPVQLQIALRPVEYRRPRETSPAMLLPRLTAVPRNTTGAPLPRELQEIPRTPSSISPSTYRAIETLREMYGVSPAPFDPKPTILPEERIVTGTGVQRTLSRIVATEFMQGDYEQTSTLLRNLLSLPMSREMEQRVRFYRAQALFFDNRLEPALLELLVAHKGELYENARPWVDGILSLKAGREERQRR